MRKRNKFSKLRHVYMVEGEAVVDPVGGEPVVTDPAAGGGAGPAPTDPVIDPAKPADPAPDYFSTAPEDWRAQMLKKAGYEEGEDFDKGMKQLERVSDFGTLAKNYLAAQEKIRKGEISNGLPENATDEQMQAYREANGVPATPQDYALQLEEGLVLGETDEKIMQGIYEIAHSKNIPADAVSEMTNAMLKGRQIEAQNRLNQDGVDKQTTDKMLKEAWASGDFETNLNMVKGLVNQLPESVKDAFLDARLPDGKAVFNSPEVMIAMADWARQINPAATVVPNSNNPMQTMETEIKALEARMSEPGWHKDKEANDRYVALVDAKRRMEA